MAYGLEPAAPIRLIVGSAHALLTIAKQCSQVASDNGSGAIGLKNFHSLQTALSESMLFIPPKANGREADEAILRCGCANGRFLA